MKCAVDDIQEKTLFFFEKCVYYLNANAWAGVVQKLHNILLWQKVINRIKRSIKKTKKTLE